MNKYKASVIIPTYNRLDDLRMSLDSLVNQDCKYPFEVIVADDGSAENTKSVIDEFVGKLNIKYCFHEDKGFRPGVARNMGIKLSEGELCIFLDCGILFHSKAVETHISVHKQEKQPSLVLGYVYAFDTERGHEQEIHDILNNNTVDDAIAMLHQEDILDVREACYKALGDDLSEWAAPFPLCWTGNMSVCRDTLMEYGMFDDNYVGWGSEDIDLGLTLFRNGIKYVLSRDASSVHIPHTKEHKWLTDPLAEFRVLQANKEYMAKKNPIRAMKMWLLIGNPIALNMALISDSEYSLPEHFKYSWRPEQLDGKAVENGFTDKA